MVWCPQIMANFKTKVSSYVGVQCSRKLEEPFCPLLLVLGYSTIVFPGEGWIS